MSARVVPFTGEWEGQHQPLPYTSEAGRNALHDARQLLAAKREADNWMSTLLLAMLTVMDERQRLALERVLAAKDTDEARQAHSIVRVQNSGAVYRERVRNVLSRLDGGGI